MVLPAPSADSDRLRNIARHIPGVIYEFVQYPDGRMAFPYTSDGLLELYGLSPEAVREDAAPMFAAVHPEDLTYLAESVQVSAAMLTPWCCEHRIYHLNGNLRWVQGNATPQRASDGSIRWYGYVRDITEQKASRLALEASEQKLRRVIDTINGLVFMVAPDLTLSLLSPAVAAVTGYAPDEFQHCHLAEVTHPDDLAHCVEQVQACLRGEGSRRIEFRALHRDGHYYWYSANLSPFTAEDGATVSCLGIATYIDDRKRAELALQESEARYQLLVANVPGMVYRYLPGSEGGAFTYVSAGCYELFGLEPAQIRQDANRVWGLIHPDDMQSLQASIASAVERCAAWSWEGRFTTVTGQLRWLQGRSRPQLTSDGLVWDGLLIDITALKQTEAALGQEVAYRRALFDASGDGIVVLSSAGQVLEANHSFAAMLGYSLDETIGLHVADFDADPEAFDEQQETDKLCLDRFERRHRRQDGSTYAVEICASAVQWNGQSVHLCVCRDIEERQRAELALAASEDRFQRLTAASPAVIYTVVESTEGIVRFDYISPAVEEVDEISVAAAMENGALLSEQIYPEDRERYLATYRASLQAMTPFSCEWRIITSSGKTKWLQANSRPEQRPNGEVVWHGITLDKTPEKQAELEIIALQSALLEAQDIAHIGNWTFDLASQRITWSPELFRLFGLDPSEGEPTYEAYLQLIHPDDRPLLLQAIEQAITQGTPYKIDYRALLPDGSIRYHEGRGKVERDGTGQIIRLLGTGLDITERKHTELALQASEARFRVIFDQAAAGINQIDASGRFVEANQYYCDLLGYTKAELMELTFADVMHPEDLAQRQAQMDHVFYGEIDYVAYEKRDRHKNGDWIWTKISISVLRDQAGQVVGNLAVVVDIRDRKRYETALQDSRQLLQTVLDTVPLAIFWKNRQSVILGCNQQFVQASGLTTPDEAIGKNTLDLGYTATEAQAYIETDGQVMASGVPRIGVQETITPVGGEQRWVETNKLPLRDWTGNVIGVVGTFQDITERKQAEAIIRQQAERETVLRKITQRIRQSLDLSAILNTAVEQMQHTLQTDRVAVYQFRPDWSGDFIAEAVHDPWVKLVNSDIQRVWEDTYLQDTQGGRFKHHETVVVADIYQAGLQPCHIELLEQFQAKAFAIAPIFFGDTLWGLLAIYQNATCRQWLDWEVELLQQIADQLAIAIQQASLFEQLQQELTERQQAQQQLSERNQELAVANQDLSRATRLKDEFLANMSHELRTPLNIILGFAQLLNADRSLPAQQRDYVNIMYSSGNHLLHLINDILDLSKIEANRITLDPESIDLLSLLHDLQAMFQDRAADKELYFTLALASDLPQYIVTDPNRLRQVLINLLGNAIKFTVSGGITLQVSLQPLEPEVVASSSAESPSPSSMGLCFAVTDTGTGIAETELAAIFDAFTQAKTNHIALEGTGLGLAISRSLVQLMGGTLMVSSRLGQGSTFQFTLPLELANAEDVISDDRLGPVIGLAPGQPVYRILVVDDHPENRALLMAALAQTGLEIEEASDGVMAIDRWREWRPHLIWMDLRMPGIDGGEATRRIRQEAQHQGEGNGPIIIALTAQASRDERARALAAGCDDFVSKPVQIDQLFTKMADYLGLRYRYAAALDQDSQPPVLQGASRRLNTSDLQVMPPSWIAALHQAAILCDGQDTTQLIQQIPAEHRLLIDNLNRLLQEYKFEVIMQLSQPAPIAGSGP
ncbi:PAS domain S-box protein [Nodosilinea sp. E11]|uniref:PAS domain S-box protein n=1 Tax=Nodosilinea sp. E11 TaxID=3037479 RepID=UPI00293529C5|nr:PAS domain S-box protein [Nodosilinea sp. E11]WOD39613.1 PAS domain S-box protein [Nodosilinea sp. E11]